MNRKVEIGFLPGITVDGEIKQGLLKTAPIKDCPAMTRYSIIIYRKDTITKDLCQRFENMIDIELSQ